MATKIQLPRKGETIAYDLDDGALLRLTLRPDGSYYGDAGEFDFDAGEAGTRERLTRWGATLAGWE